MRLTFAAASLFLLLVDAPVRAEVFCTGDGAGGFRCVDNGKRVVPPPPAYRPASAPKKPASAASATAQPAAAKR